MMNTTNSAAPADDMALDLSRLLKAIGVSMKWLLPLVLVVAGCTFIALGFVPSKYRGEAKVLIESTDARFPGTTRGVEEERALLDTEGVASQVQLLMSADLARRVAKRLELASVPEFEAARSGSLLSDALAMLGLSKGSSRSSVEEKVLKHYYKNIEVYRLEGSRVIAVEYSAQDPEIAAAVANTVVDEYVALQATVKRNSTEDVASAMEPQIAQLRQEVQAARKAVEDYRARADLLIGTDNLTLNQRQLSEISSQYSAAQAKKAEAQAKADLIRELLQSGGSLETASDVLNSQLIQRLRERQVALQSNIAELSITLLPNHPQLKALNSQLADYNRQIRSEARKVLIGLENDAKVSSQQSAALERRLNELKTAAARSNADQVRLNELEREANAKAAQLDKLLSSFREADLRLRAQTLPADARIISRASIPGEPYSPKVKAITIIAALVTMVLGIAFVILREFLSGNVLYPVAEGEVVAPRAAEIRAPEPKWATAGANANASNVTLTGTFSGFDADYSDGKPNQKQGRSLGEKLRRAKARDTAQPVNAAYDQDLSPDWLPADSAQNAEEFSLAPEAPEDGRLVVLSVDEPHVAHDLALSLARAAEADGAHVLLVEAAPGRAEPNVEAGFADLVSGDAAFSNIIFQDSGSNVHIIEAGRVAISDELAAGDRFSNIFETISNTYDVTIVSLGTIDGTLASAKLLGLADRVLVTAMEEDYGQELVSAANLLERNTGAVVEVVSKDGQPVPVARSSKHGGRAA